jgi:serine phosphatase RsbU (regulator of sigma subunit)
VFAKEQARTSHRRDGRDEHLGRTVLADLRQAGVPRSLWRDLKSIRRFYLDDDKRARLTQMGWLRRTFWQFAWILREMLLRLSPPRRLLTLVSLVFFVMGPTTFVTGMWTWEVNLRVWGFVLLFLVLMLELKDELLARDEIEVAREVQLGLLPDHAPEIPGWDVWLYTRPANHVGGDVVDAFRVDGERVGIALGDVAGKGLGAALLAAKLQATVRALAPACDGLDDLAGSVNEIMARDSLPNRFSTMAYVELPADGSKVELFNAGHCPPKILRRQGAVETLAAGGLPLGIDAAERFREFPVSLAPGDALVIYSDGLSEARRQSDDAMFGEGPLEHVFAELRNLDAERIGRRLLRAVDEFVGGERLEDDLSLVVLRRRHNGASEGVTPAGAPAAPASAVYPPVHDPHSGRG